MKIIVAGSREFNNYELVCEILNKAKWTCNDEIISGTANGADSLGERYAIENGISLKRFPADWNRYGKKAGYIRNKEMADYCTGAIIFWNGISRGSKNMIDIMKKSGKPYKVIKFK